MARMLGALAAYATLLLLSPSACSTVPQDRFPAFEERSITATYDFAAADAPRAAVPSSNADVVVLELSSTPPFHGEVFEHGQRYLLPPPHCTSMTVHCRYRAYAQDGAVPTPQQLFPAATVAEQP